MKILVTGATGLIGKRLLENLILNGHEDIRILTRNRNSAREAIPFPVEIVEWNPEENYIEENALLDVNIVIHLAGENISSARWNKEKKNEILTSRTKSTQLLINEIKKLSRPPEKFISSSAIGIYGSSLSDKIFTAESELGNDFLAEVCKAWELPLKTLDIPQMKTYSLRTGVVLSNEGGALSKMLPAFLMGAAGTLGNGKQYMSWIHIDDLVSQFLFLIKNEGKSKIYNGVSPTPVTNSEFTKALGRALSRPTIFPVPAFALKLVLGEMSDILLKGQRVSPKEFLDEGFQFKYPTIELALKDLLKHINAGEVLFKKYLWINKSTPEVFEFFSDEKNLERITPPYLNFKILRKSSEQISKGTLIDYKLRIHGVPASWKTEITSFEKDKTFTDNQLQGPYKKWTHQHDFIPCKKGTLMKDLVVYKVPMGFLGNLVAGAFVKKDVTEIFKYRNKIIKSNFESYT